MDSEEREFGGVIYLNCNHITEEEMARIHGLPVVRERLNDDRDKQKAGGVVYRCLSKAALRWGDIPIIGRILWWAFDVAMRKRAPA